MKNYFLNIYCRIGRIPIEQQQYNCFKNETFINPAYHL